MARLGLEEEVHWAYRVCAAVMFTVEEDVIVEPLPFKAVFQPLNVKSVLVGVGNVP